METFIIDKETSLLDLIEYYNESLDVNGFINFCSIENAIDKLESVIMELSFRHPNLFILTKYTILFGYEIGKKMTLKIEKKLTLKPDKIPEGYTLLNKDISGMVDKYTDIPPEFMIKEENKILNDYKVEEIILEYKINQGNGKIQIFGKEFIKNNMNNLDIIFNGINLKL